VLNYKRRGGGFCIMVNNVNEKNESEIITFIEPKEKLNISKALENLDFQENDKLECFELFEN
jgi:hypothetical protein